MSKVYANYSLGPGLTFQKGPWKYKANESAPVQRIPWKGGGVSGGGQGHAGNGNWFSQMNPQASPMKFSRMPSVGKYASVVTIHDISEKKKRGPPSAFSQPVQQIGPPMSFSSQKPGQQFQSTQTEPPLEAVDEPRAPLVESSSVQADAVPEPPLPGEIVHHHNVVTNNYHHQAPSQPIVHNVTNVINQGPSQEMIAANNRSDAMMERIIEGHQGNDALRVELEHARVRLAEIHGEYLAWAQGAQHNAMIMEQQRVVQDMRQREVLNHLLIQNERQQLQLSTAERLMIEQSSQRLIEHQSTVVLHQNSGRINNAASSSNIAEQAADIAMIEARVPLMIEDGRDIIIPRRAQRVPRMEERRRTSPTQAEFARRAIELPDNLAIAPGAVVPHKLGKRKRKLGHGTEKRIRN